MVHSRIFKHKFLIFIPMLVVLILAVACGDDATPTTQPTSAPQTQATNTPVPTAMPGPTEAPQTQATNTPMPTAMPGPTEAIAPLPGKLGGVITMQYHGPPAHWSAWEGFFTMNAVNEPMYNQVVEYNPETEEPLDIRGDLAESWTVSEDGQTYIFKLYENARWHDGKPVTAADVKFSIDSWLDPALVCPSVGPCLLRAYVQGAQVIDDQTVEVNLKFPAAAFMSYFANNYTSIRQKEYSETGVDYKLVENVLGSGAFLLKEYKKDISMEYVKNPDYWKEGLPYLDGMKYFIIRNGAASFAAYKAGQTMMSVSMVSVMPNSDAFQLASETENKGTVHWDGPASVLQIHLHNQKEPFTNKLVKKAMHLATYRQPMIELLTKGRATLGYPLPPGFWFAPTNEEVAQMPGFRELNGEKHPDDLAEAKRLMTEAGFAGGFKTQVLAPTTLDPKEVALIWSDQMRRFLDIEIEVDITESNVAIERRLSGDYLTYSHSDGLAVHDPEDMFTRSFITGSSHNRINRGDVPPRIGELHELQTRELDRETRKALATEAAEIMLDDLPLIPLYWVERWMYLDNRIKNFNIHPSAYGQIYKWEHIWCDPACN